MFDPDTTSIILSLMLVGFIAADIHWEYTRFRHERRERK